VHLEPLVKDLAVILIVAGIAAVLFRRLKQPMVLGYLLAGIVVGPNTPPFSWVTDQPGIRLWAELGVVFLLFNLGLEFNFKRLRGLGFAPVFIGTFEALFMFALGFGAGKAAGWSDRDGLFFGSILAVSSTAIIVKAIEELNLKKERFAELVFGSLVVDDLVGIMILAGIATLGMTKASSSRELLSSGLKLVGFVGGWLLFGHFVLNRFLNKLSRVLNREEITLLSVGLCLALAVASTHFKFSAALGAFLMGSTLGESHFSERIDRAMRPLQDIFGAIFFVATGMLLDPSDVKTNWGMILIAVLLTLFGKIFSVYLSARLTGQTNRTSLQMGCAMAQIGEFSFIIAAVGLTMGVMRPELYPIAVSVSVLTTFTTPYLIRASRKRAIVHNPG
jgi:CPA2 family monovalent cation:H+ antiporter-2